ncbi:hypothetical protein ACGVWS_06640 [Enterobacteriaceae bacterium LUAb1]
MSKKNALFPVVKEAIAFERLWQQATEMVSALSGEIWNDQGEHDPGVTLLQAVVWNCADLSYRAALPLNDLLTHSKGQPTLFPAEFGPDHVLTCSAVTAEDYRRIVLDLHSSDIPLHTQEQGFLFSDACLIKEPEEHRFHWWYNAEQREYSFTEPEMNNGEGKEKIMLRGNLWLLVIPGRLTQALSSDNRASVEHHLRDILAGHRNAGEQISRIIWLKPVEFSPRIKIELSDDISDASQTAAQIFQITEALLQPPVVRHTTDQRRALGEPCESLFEGPRLQHGWQQPLVSQISPEGITINLSLLINQLLSIPGVVRLSQLSVTSLPEQINAVREDCWSWQVDAGYFPLLWGDDPLALLAGSNSPLILMTKGGIYHPLNRETMAECLTTPELIQTPAEVLPAGRLRNLRAYIPLGDRLPACYALQQADKVKDDHVRALHQFLLPADQLLADGCAELALVPELLAFNQRGNAIRGTRWPYQKTSVNQTVHHACATELSQFQRRNAAIFPDNRSQPDQTNLLRELDFLRHLLGYFGTEHAARPLTLDSADFLASQRAYLAQQPELGYARSNMRTGQVSALQKRIAARTGLGSGCFADNPDLSQLPFYLVEHRQLLPPIPDRAFNTEQTPETFTAEGHRVTLTQQGIASRIIPGQLIDLIITGQAETVRINQLLVMASGTHSLTFSTMHNQHLLNNLERLQAAFHNQQLRWQNSQVWLQDMDYRLNYAPAAEQPEDPHQRLLVSNAQSPWPALVSRGDVIAIVPAELQFATTIVDNDRAVVAEEAWRLDATIEEIDPLAGTLLIKKAADSKHDFPSAPESFRYQWYFAHSRYATADRFSFVISAVMNRRILENENIKPRELMAWVQKTIMAECPAHISLMSHWLDPAAFNNFAMTWKHWQNNGARMGDDAYAIMRMLTLGHLPATHLGIGMMRLATDAQRRDVMGEARDQWNTATILSEALFCVPPELTTR